MQNNINLFKLLLSVFIIAILFIAIVLSVYFYNFSGNISLKHEEWGAFGDFVGGSLNPALSFLALIALLVTLWLQSKQTEISVQELSETRAELRRSAEAQESSTRHQKRQVKIQELTARISVITLLLEYDEKVVPERRLGIMSVSSIDVKQVSGSSAEDLIGELGGIYLELKDIELEMNKQT